MTAAAKSRWRSDAEVAALAKCAESLRTVLEIIKADIGSFPEAEADLANLDALSGAQEQAKTTKEKELHNDICE